MHIQGQAVYPYRPVPGKKQAFLPNPSSHQPRFGLREEHPSSQQGSMFKPSLAWLGILATGVFPYLAYKGYQLFQAELFNGLVQSDNANEQVSRRYPDTYCGEYEAALHHRMRVLAEGAASGNHRQVALFKKMLTLPRIQTLMARELSGKSPGKPRLADIIQEQGKHNPNMVTHLTGLIQQSIRHGEAWDHFTAVINNLRLWTALEEKNVVVVLEELKHRSLCKQDKRQPVLAERLLANPYNFGIIVRATGGNQQAKDFIRQLVATEIDQDLHAGSGRDYVAQQKACERAARERMVCSLPLETQQALATQHNVTIEELADALSPEAAPDFDAEAQRKKEAEAREIWRWKDTSEEKLQPIVEELTDLAMKQYEPQARHQVNP